MNVADVASYSSVLLLNFPDNLLEQSRNNTVVVQREEMDRVGFEPTTSAYYFFEDRRYLCWIPHLKNRDIETES